MIRKDEGKAMLDDYSIDELCIDILEDFTVEELKWHLDWILRNRQRPEYKNIRDNDETP